MELQVLQQQLKEVQKKNNGFKLSERTIVDLIQKIMKRGKVKLNFTLNGKEYVTNEKVLKEIQDHVKSHQGIISKIELNKLIDISSNVIENNLDYLIKTLKGINTLQIIEGKVVSKAYLNRIKDDINQLLEDNQGCIQLSELSTLFDFSTNFMKKFISDLISNGEIKATLYPTRILTEEFLSNQKSKIRPILIASTQPIPLLVFVEQYGVDETIVPELIRECIKDGIKGTFNNNIFEPMVYTQFQSQFLHGTLSQNNYVEYSKINKIGIKDHKAFIKSNVKDGVFLSDCFIDTSLKARFETTFYDNHFKGKVTNYNSILDFELSEDDCSTLLSSINFDSSTISIIDSNIIPLSFVSEFIKTVDEKLSAEAVGQYNSYIEKIKEKEKKRKLQEEQQQKEKESEKKKGGKKSNNNKKDTQNNNDDDDKAELTEIFKKSVKLELKARLNYDEMNNAEQTLDEIFQKLILSKIELEFKRKLQEMLKSKKSNNATVNNTENADSQKSGISIEAQIEADFSEVKILQKTYITLESMSNDPQYTNAIKALATQYCKSNLTNLFKNIIIKQFSHMKIKLDPSKLASHNSRKDLLSSSVTGIDEEVGGVLLQLNDYIQSKNVNGFLSCFEKNVKNLAVSIIYNDKKREKSLIEKFNSINKQKLDKDFSILGKTTEIKDYNQACINICERLLIDKLYFVQLPNEAWSFSVLFNIIKGISKDSSVFNEKIILLVQKISEILALKEVEFDKQLSDLVNLLLEFKTQYLS